MDNESGLLSNLSNAASLSNNDEEDYSKDTQEVIITVLTAAFLGIVTLCTVIGNVFVIAAILIERNLRSIGNYLVFSLAIADLMVACLGLRLLY